MPNDPQYDVAIVGASIAGCTAAIFFARNGARVALIERDPDPAAYKKSARISFYPAPPRQSSGLVSRTQSRQLAAFATTSRYLRDGDGSSLHRHEMRHGQPMATIFGVRRSTP
jgi:2-polyprenyl-6-methoxyphenol hydroxylase-like FAD-dependent oxidoreductase